MFYPTDSCKNTAINNTLCAKEFNDKDVLCIKDENCHPNQQVNMNAMSKTEKKSSLDYVPKMNESTDSEKVTKDTEELNIVIRRVGMEDHLSIVKLFQVN